MGKPVENVILQTTDGRVVQTTALFDTGSFYTIIREDVLPAGAPVLTYTKPERLGTAGKEGGVEITSVTNLIVTIGEKMISTRVFVSPDLRREFLIGAETMQAWDISVRTANGKTEVHVGHDMRDPEITEVD